MGIFIEKSTTGSSIGVFELVMVLLSSAVIVLNFKVSMAHETVGEGGGRILGEGGGWLFTLHSDQSFLNTPELRDSRIGTHPVGKKHSHEF